MDKAGGMWKILQATKVKGKQRLFRMLLGSKGTWQATSHIKGKALAR